ncbi:hypothetical protein [Dorea phocaeensis]|uniref:hypothetical protein n=2 Tax=Lachnospiraceae TaxID=186803 RepID=UPI001FC8AC71|nr:hypothetical protein [Dorea phocaeensis]
MCNMQYVTDKRVEWIYAVRQEASGFLALLYAVKANTEIPEEIKEIGYSHMLLDTLPFLESVIHIYKKFGLYEIESYNDSPMDTSIYMRLDL